MEEEGKKLGFCRVEVGHGRATTGTGRAKLLVFGVGKALDGTAVPLQARPVLNFWHLRLKKNFLRFLESVSDNYLQTNLKQTKSD